MFAILPLAFLYQQKYKLYYKNKFRLSENYCHRDIKDPNDFVIQYQSVVSD